MSAINILGVQVLDNPTKFSNPYQFEICYECIQSLQEDLEWKIIYIGSAENEEYDQELDSVMVGPVTKGIHKFVFQADPPDWTKIPENDLVGVTAVLLTCSYRDKEFIRVGYYVNIEYDDLELRENPPPSVELGKLSRNILADKPRVTRFPIDWSDGMTPQTMEQQQQQQLQQQQLQQQPLDPGAAIGTEDHFVTATGGGGGGEDVNMGLGLTSGMDLDSSSRLEVAL
eukprot:CAMPEP_0184654938 /NCGR_PEP_ID=MMETSP0308-20130426/12591_1 /TAXON_ID=38269 /ORGANISM="Gloeochaete witrockiana, Strain SAG 46.84" /LENGTH=227 /DNA_ID=CAMNT_0027091155 /DNA_START=104 /DNA_END=787 /DNA_ORIENTATION=+